MEEILKKPYEISVWTEKSVPYDSSVELTHLQQGNLLNYEDVLYSSSNVYFTQDLNTFQFAQKDKIEVVIGNIQINTAFTISINDIVGLNEAYIVFKDVRINTFKNLYFYNFLYNDSNIKIEFVSNYKDFSPHFRLNTLQLEEFGQITFYENSSYNCGFILKISCPKEYLLSDPINMAFPKLSHFKDVDQTIGTWLTKWFMSEDYLTLEEYYKNNNIPYKGTDNNATININYFEEEKIAVIGSDTMTSQMRAHVPKLVSKINGSNTFTFQMYNRYIDNITGETVDNILIPYLCNERKIKLRYGAEGAADTKWYDFIIKNIDESTDHNTFTYTCTDVYINELSKNGYNLTFDTELTNNIGKVTELAKQVVDGTEWYIDEENSDYFVESKPETLYEFNVNSDATGSINFYSFKYDNENELLCERQDGEWVAQLWKDGVYSPYSISNGQILIPYSAYINKKSEFQIFYFYNPENPSDNSIINKSIEDLKDLVDENYNIICGSKYQSPFVSGVVTNFDWDMVNSPEVTDYRAKVLTQQQKTYYDTTLKKLVTLYKDGNGKTIYCYTQNEFASPTMVRNYTANNTNFTSTDGWSPSGGNSIKLGYRIEGDKYKSLLHSRFTQSNFTKNAGIESNRSLLNGLNEGDIWVLRIKSSRLRPTTNDIYKNANYPQFNTHARYWMSQRGYWDTSSESHGGFDIRGPLTEGRGLCAKIAEYEYKNGKYVLGEEYAHFSWGHTPKISYYGNSSEIARGSEFYGSGATADAILKTPISDYYKAYYLNRDNVPQNETMGYNKDKYFRYSFRKHLDWSQDDTTKPYGRVSDNNQDNYYGKNNPMCNLSDSNEIAPFLIQGYCDEGVNNYNYLYKYMLAPIKKSASYNDLLNKRIGLFIYSWGPYGYSAKHERNDDYTNEGVLEFPNGKDSVGNANYRLIQDIDIEDIQLFPFKTEKITAYSWDYSAGEAIGTEENLLILPDTTPNNKKLMSTVYNCYYPQNSSELNQYAFAYDTNDKNVTIGPINSENGKSFSNVSTYIPLQYDIKSSDLTQNISQTININEKGSFVKAFIYAFAKYGYRWPTTGIGDSNGFPYSNEEILDKNEFPCPIQVDSNGTYITDWDEKYLALYGKSNIKFNIVAENEINELDRKLKVALSKIILEYETATEVSKNKPRHIGRFLQLLLEMFINQPDYLPYRVQTNDYSSYNFHERITFNPIGNKESVPNKLEHYFYLSMPLIDMGQADDIIADNLRKTAEYTTFKYIGDVDDNSTLYNALTEKDICYIYKGTNLPESEHSEWTKIMEKGYEKIRTIKAKESNRFNIIQSICENFECWALFNIGHTFNGKIEYKTQLNKDGFTIGYVPNKSIAFKRYVGKDNYAGFRYGINLKSIKRTLNSDQLVSKLIVAQNSNEYGKNGFCTIARAEDNVLKENFIYNFDHYIRNNLLNNSDIVKDLYSTEGLNYYNQIYEINKDKVANNERLAEWITAINNIEANYTAFNEAKIAAEENIAQIINSINTQYSQKLTTANEAIKYINAKKDASDSLKSMATELATLTSSLTYATQQSNKWKKDWIDYQSMYDQLANDMAIKLQKIKDLNNLFFNKYSRFIQEGTWHSDDYLDDNLYYMDALNVSMTSISPKVTYNISVIEISEVEGYQGYYFEVGDKTYVEDTEFFGYQPNGKPYQEAIVVTETTFNLDSPEQNQIKVQNYKTQFEDLFNRIAASTQTLQYNKNSYQRAADILTTNGNIKDNLIDSSLDKNNATITNAKDQTVTTDKNGITIQNGADKNNLLRLVNQGIMFSNDGGLTWKVGISGQGINSTFLKLGQLDTNNVSIINGDGFLVNALGIQSNQYENELYYNYLLINNINGSKANKITPIAGFNNNKYISYNKDGIQCVNNNKDEFKNYFDLLLNNTTNIFELDEGKPKYINTTFIDNIMATLKKKFNCVPDEIYNYNEIKKQRIEGHLNNLNTLITNIENLTDTNEKRSIYTKFNDIIVTVEINEDKKLVYNYQLSDDLLNQLISNNIITDSSFSDVREGTGGVAPDIGISAIVSELIAKMESLNNITYLDITSSGIKKATFGIPKEEYLKTLSTWTPSVGHSPQYTFYYPNIHFLTCLERTNGAEGTNGIELFRLDLGMILCILIADALRQGKDTNVLGSNHDQILWKIMDFPDTPFDSNSMFAGQGNILNVIRSYSGNTEKNRMMQQATYWGGTFDGLGT